MYTGIPGRCVFCGSCVYTLRCLFLWVNVTKRVFTRHSSDECGDNLDLGNVVYCYCFDGFFSGCVYTVFG